MKSQLPATANNGCPPAAGPAILLVARPADDHLADCLYRAAVLWLPGHKLRKDYSDGDPDWESDFYILKNTFCGATE